MELPGSGAAFSVDGLKIAYLRLAPVGELIAAQASVDASTPAERPQRQNALNQLIAALTRLVYTVTVAQGGKQFVIGGPVDKLEIITAREAGSGMAAGKRQHGFITITKEWGATNRTVHVVSDSNWIKVTVTGVKKAPMGKKPE